MKDLMVAKGFKLSSSVAPIIAQPLRSTEHVGCFIPLHNIMEQTSGLEGRRLNEDCMVTTF